MNGSRSAAWIAAMVLASLCAEPYALAQRRRSPEPQQQEQAVAPQQDDSTARARQAYERGRAAFTANNFQEALTAFQEAYEAKPHPTVLVSIAECQERLQQWPAMVETLERYLRDAPQARDRAQVEQKIAAARARPAILNVTSEPPGAKIFLDGTDTGKVTPSELEVAPGDHAIKLTMSGYVDAQEQVTVSFGERRDMPIALDTPEPETPPPSTPGPRHSEGTPAALYIGAGLTGVGLVAGTVLGFLALSEKSDFDDSPNVESADRGENYALIADISFGVAVAAGIATAVMYFTRSSGSETDSDDSDAGDDEDDDGDDEEEEEHDVTQDEDYVRLRVLPLAMRRGGGVAAQVDF